MAPVPDPAGAAPAHGARVRGVLLSWNDERGFGFLQPSNGGKDVFLHASALRKEGRQIEIGREYEFEVEVGRDGRPKAKDAVIVRQETRGPRLVERLTQRGPRLMVIPAFAFIVIAIALVQPVSPNWFIIYGAASLACFAGYGLDKRAANHRSWRVSETILLMIGLVGGWPGGIIAQEVFRHKTQKKTFRTLFWMSVAINMAAFVQINVFSGR